MYDEDNAISLSVDNPHGDHFQVYGGKRLLSKANVESLDACKNALLASSGEIYRAWHDKINPEEFSA